MRKFYIEVFTFVVVHENAFVNWNKQYTNLSTSHMKNFLTLSSALILALFSIYAICFWSCIKKCGTPPDLKSLIVSNDALEKFPYKVDSTISVNLRNSGETLPPLTLTCVKKRRNCLHTWKCPNDESIKETYWESVEEHHFRLISSWIEIDLYVYPERDETNLEKYVEKFKVDIHEAVYTCCVFEFIINDGNDTSKYNDHLDYYEEITLNNNTFYKVYANRLTEYSNHKIYYTEKEGIIGFYRKEDGKTYSIQ